jgi:hypothetical protein
MRAAVCASAAAGRSPTRAREPVAPASAPGASPLDDAEPLPSTDAGAEAEARWTDAPSAATAGTTVPAVAAPAEAPDSTAMVIPIAPKECSRDRFTRIASSLDVP